MARRAAATAAQLEAEKIVSELAQQSKPAEQFYVAQRTLSVPPMSGWLKVTSIKTGYTVLVPLPIRLIHQIPDEKGGGCIVRGAHGDEATAKESIVQILTALNGYPVGGDISTWALAG